MNNLTPEALADIFERNGHEAIVRDTDDVSILCPFCPATDPDRKYKCYAHPYKNMFHCFRCGTSGRIWFLFKEMGIKSGEIAMSTGQMRERIIKSKVNTKFGKGRSKLISKMNAAELPEEYLPLIKNSYGHGAQMAYAWLKRRGLSWAEIKKWKIGFCVEGFYSEHLILPIKDRDGDVVTFQARRFLGTIEPKSKNPVVGESTVSKTDVLYGIHQVQGGEPIVLVEGPFDVIALNRSFLQLELPHRALGLMGHQLSRIQRHLLLDLRPVEVFVMMDADAAQEGKSIARNLAAWLTCRVYWSPLVKGDPDDLTNDEIVKIIASSIWIRPKSTPFESRPIRHV